MDSTTLIILIIFHVVAGIVLGAIFVAKGYKEDDPKYRNLTLIKTGWIIIGTTSALLSFGLMILITMMGGISSILGWIIIIGPFIIVAGLIVTLVIGVDSLSKGYSKTRNTKLITRGWILIGINLSVLTSIIVLLVLFMGGYIPIRLM